MKMHFSKGLGGLKMSHLWTNTTSFEVEGKGLGANLAVLSLWLFRTVRLLNLSLVIDERSHVYKFQAAEKYLSPAEPDCTCRIHQ